MSEQLVDAVLVHQVDEPLEVLTVRLVLGEVLHLTPGGKRQQVGVLGGPALP